jgi:dynein assembly factor 1
VQQNCLRTLDGLGQLPNLNTLNVSSNGLTSLQGLDDCPLVATLNADRNHLSTAAALAPLLKCASLHTLDLQHNEIEDTDAVDLIVQVPQLRCLYLAGNPVVSKIPSYRKALIARCPHLTYLDDRLVTEEERRWCQAW